MTKISTEVKTRFMPHKIARLIGQTYIVTLECLAYYIYFKQIQKQPKKHNDWLIATANAYYDLLVLRWCMLFGSERNEPTHFYHLADNKYLLKNPLRTKENDNLKKAWLKDYILAKAHISHSDFHKYRADTLRYRNKYLIHREHNPDTIHEQCMHFPHSHEILKTTFSLYELLVKIADNFSEYSDKQNSHPFNYIVFKNRTELSEYYLSTYPLKRRSKNDK